MMLSLLAASIGTACASDLLRPPTLAEQAAAMPSDFRQHFFNVPVSARVMLDGKLLGDANIVLDEAERVQIISFLDVADSAYSESDRQHWLQALSSPYPLGTCRASCPTGLIALDYNLSNAQLNLLTPDSTGSAASRWHQLPESSSNGMLLSTQFNATGGQQQPSAVSLFSGLEAGLGNWTTISEFQADRSSADDAPTRHAVTSMYLLRESRTTFFRGGLFMPDSQGLLRQPYNRGGVTTLAGVMAGSSDTLLKEGEFSSQFPVWVTANREGVAEIYRDGALINSQPVTPGLQALNTAPLPTGIYEVEIRIMEDGRETSRTTETIIKSTSWRNPDQRLRWNLFAGRQSSLWNSQHYDHDGQAAAGVSINYLLHPSLTSGVALQKTGKERQTGVSLDWQAARQVKLYGNLWHSSLTGQGLDAQALWQHDQGNIALNHNRSWFNTEDDSVNDNAVSSRPSTQHTTALSSTYRLNRDNSVNGRVSRNSSTNGIGVDVGYSTRSTLASTSVNWRLAGFDRPYRDNSSLRNRGASLSASFQLGAEGRSASASLGSRSDSNGARDLYASVTGSQQWENSFIKETNATVTMDRHGAGLSSYNSFDMPAAVGGFWGQRSSQDGLLSGGVNLGSTLALGQGGKAVISRQPLQHQGGGMIVDVLSDDPEAELVAHHDGGSTPLKPGRNFIPLDAWKPGTVQLDFVGKDAPALKVWPQYLNYHQIRGGVSSHEVRVMKTVTVMGRLVDHDGNSLAGAHVINHAGHTMTEADGMFTLELHEKNPVVSIEHPASGLQCEIRLSPATQKRDEMVFAGNLTCDGVTTLPEPLITPQPEVAKR
jgi:hypothetical protein